jgi:hypothetical protein
MWSLIVLIGVSMGAGIVAMLIPSRRVPDEVMISVIVIGIHAAFGLMVLAMSKRAMRLFAVCISALMISMVLWVIFIWLESQMGWRQEHMYIRFVVGIETIAGVLAHRMLIAPLSIGHTSFGHTIQRATLASGVFVGAMIISGMLYDAFDDSELFVRLFFVSLILCVGLSFTSGAMGLLIKRPDEDESSLIHRSTPVELKCPRCAQRIELGSNRDDRCTHCRLKIRVEVEEPRCECGYSLFELASDKCPECGNEIDPDDRWGAEADTDKASLSASDID